MFIPVLLESAAYAFLVAWGVGRLVARLGLGGLEGQGVGAELVASAGAGLHEELVFRAGLFAGLAWLLSRRLSTAVSLVVAGLVSSALFSAVHYVGPLGDRFALGSFAFRLFCGLVFTVIYRVRGFALAAWTHALYDVFYFLGRHV
jgi:membrane protease YdiL (CAAX protease family)